MGDSAKEIAGSVTLEVYDPTGTVEISPLHAPRLDTLEGKTIGEVSNRIWEADRMFPLIRQLLQTRFPGIKFIPYTEFPALVYPEPENIGDLAKVKGCDAVIVGNAA
ncbi:hypothetical protein ACFLWI_04770 [Chloroflexota bacterium]